MRLNGIRRFTLLSGLIGFVLAGCSASPTAPTGLPNLGGSTAPPTQAVIDGTVVNSANLAQSNVLVSMDATGQSSTTDGRGHFRLAKVPTGQQVQLRLQRGSMNTTVNVQRMSQNQMLQVTVQINGSSAQVSGAAAIGMNTFDAYVVSVDQVAQTLTLQGNVVVQVDANTVFDNDDDALQSLAQVAAALAAGQQVSAEGAGMPNANGAILAAYIEAEVDNGGVGGGAPPPGGGTPGTPGSTVHYEGYVTAVNQANNQFTLNNTLTITVNAATVFYADDDDGTPIQSFAQLAAAFAAGQKVEAEVYGTVQADGSILATQVEAEVDNGADDDD